MTVSELTVKVYVLENVESNQLYNQIASLIDTTLSKDPKFLKLHQENTFKNYCFDGLYPLEKGGSYQKGKIYSFRIRTIDEKLLKYLTNHIANAYTSRLKVLTVVCRDIPQKHLEKIFTITPCILKNDGGYWRKLLSIDEYENRIKVNLIKNYNDYFNVKIDEAFQFFTRIEFNNEKPIAVPFKDGISLLGDKITLYISENQTAQELAYFALGVGLGEIGSRGFGFPGYRYL